MGHLMIIFLLIKIICCDPSSELSHRDGSVEGSQHVLCRINKNYLLSPNTPSYLELYLHVCQGLLTRTIMCESFLYAVELGTIKKNF